MVKNIRRSKLIYVPRKEEVELQERAEKARQEGRVFLTADEYYHQRSFYRPILRFGAKEYPFEKRYDAAIKVLEYLYHCSMADCGYDPRHGDFNMYVSIFLGNICATQFWLAENHDVRYALEVNFGVLLAIKSDFDQYTFSM